MASKPKVILSPLIYAQQTRRLSLGCREPFRVSGWAFNNFFFIRLKKNPENQKTWRQNLSVTTSVLVNLIRGFVHCVLSSQFVEQYDKSTDTTSLDGRAPTFIIIPTFIILTVTNQL